MVATAQLTKRDFQTDQEVRWCPGCGDYAILAAVQRVLPKLGIAREKTVFVSGIGCSSRFPYYVNTFGFHTIHGRAPAVATGIKVANPELSVWVITGDGDGLSIGAGHLLHALRRNVDLNILLFNNRIYGLTKGQASPTSEQGKLTKSTPFGLIDAPFAPLSVALGAGASFIARAVDKDPKRLETVIERAAAHKGTSFVEIFQNCNVFNDGAFDHVTEKSERANRQLWLERDKPLLFADGKRALTFGPAPELEPMVVDANTPDLPVHNEHTSSVAWAKLLTELEPPEFPAVMGVFRDTPRPTYEDGVHRQIVQAQERKGPSTIHEILRSGDVWKVD